MAQTVGAATVRVNPDGSVDVWHTELAVCRNPLHRQQGKHPEECWVPAYEPDEHFDGQLAAAESADRQIQQQKLGGQYGRQADHGRGSRQCRGARRLARVATLTRQEWRGLGHG